MSFATVSLFTGVFVAGLFSASIVRADANLENGKTLYETKCTKCHGSSGGGDGKSAKKLDTQPKSFQDASIWTDKKGLDMSPVDRMTKAIKEGGPAVKESKEMDAYPDFTAQEVTDLLAYIKTFSK